MRRVLETVRGDAWWLDIPNLISSILNFQTARFTVGEQCAVFNEAGVRVKPGSGERGRVCEVIGLGRLGYLVMVNNKLLGLFQPTGSVSVFGNGGNDTFSYDVTMPNGHDTITDLQSGEDLRFYVPQGQGAQFAATAPQWPSRCASFSIWRASHRELVLQQGNMLRLFPISPERPDASLFIPAKHWGIHAQDAGRVARSRIHRALL